VIGFVAAGLVIGVVARLVKPGNQRLSLLATVLVGLGGSVIGGVVANAIGTGDLFELNVVGFLVAVGSAILLLGALEGFANTRER
jgi:uncharacterized membrane protein YeaQ/YmgE (transglycosylase-associated protein family)